LATPVTFTRNGGESSGSPCVCIYACWSRLGPPICLGRGPANGAGPPLAIVLCSLLLLSLFRTNIELIRMSSIIRQTFFAVFERSSSPSLPLCVRSCSYRYCLLSKLPQYLSPLFSSHFLCNTRQSIRDSNVLVHRIPQVITSAGHVALSSILYRPSVQVIC
jgi:hypothetical protein